MKKKRIGAAVEKPGGPPPPGSSSRASRYAPYVALSVIVALVVVVRINLLGIPFERDEGIYNYCGQLVLEGKRPYIDFYEMKPLGLYFSYAALNFCFGTSYQASHAAFMFVNVGTMVVLFFIGKSLFGSVSGLVTAAAYGILSLAPIVSGFASQAEHLVAFFSCCGVLALLSAFDAQKKRSFLFAGVLIGFAFLIKQSAIFFILFGGMSVVAFYLSRKPLDRNLLIKNALIYSAGVFGVYLSSVLILISYGALQEFWFWTYELPKLYVGVISFEEGLEFFQLYWRKVTENYFLLWSLGGVGWSGVFFTRLYVVRYAVSKWTKSSTATSIGVAAFVIAAVVAIHKEKDYYFAPDFHEILREVYSTNPFPEAKVIGDFIKERTTESDTVALIGSEPEIYIYSGRRAPSRHAYFSHLVKTNPESKQWQDEFIADIRRERPKYLVLFTHPGSLLIWPGADTQFLESVKKISREYYRRVGFVDMLPEEKSVYRWHDEIRGYKAVGRYNIHVFERLN
jgi:hypothetical protein